MAIEISRFVKAVFPHAIFAFAGFIINAAVLLTAQDWSEHRALNKTLSSFAVANFISDVYYVALRTFYSYHDVTGGWTSKDTFIEGWLHYVNDQVLISILFSHILLVIVEGILVSKFPLLFNRIFTTKVTLCILLFIWIFPAAIAIDGNLPQGILYATVSFGVILTSAYILLLCRWNRKWQQSKAVIVINGGKWKGYSLPTLQFIVFFLLLSLFGPLLAFVANVTTNNTKADLENYNFLSFFAIKTVLHPSAFFFVSWYCMKTTAEGKIEAAGNP